MDKWVKKIVGIILLVLIIALIILDNIYTNRAVNTCIDNGQEVKVCEELYK